MSSTANVLWWFNLGKFFQLKARETFNIFSSIALLAGGSCHLRDRVGYKHRFQDITQSSNVQDLIECSERCQRLSFCRSFSFKYAGGFNSESNCLLSSIRIEDVDYVNDQDWDLYEIQQLCQRRNNQGSGGLTQQQTLQGRCT